MTVMSISQPHNPISRPHDMTVGMMGRKSAQKKYPAVKRGIVEIFCNVVTFVDKAYQNHDLKQYANVKDNDQDDQQLVKNYIMRPFQIESFYQYYMSLGCLSQKEISQQMPAYQLSFRLCCK